MRFKHRSRVVIAVYLLLVPHLAARQNQVSPAGGRIVLGRLATGQTVTFDRASSGAWGISIARPGAPPLVVPQPARLDLFRADDGQVHHLAVGYESVAVEAKGVTAHAEVRGDLGVSYAIEDRWSLADSVLSVTRKLTVKGSGRGGFASGISVEGVAPAKLDYFAPGMVYGGMDRLEDVPARGGPPWYGIVQYRSPSGEVRIREDRFPAPVFGIRFEDGSTVAILNPSPRGDTTSADGADEAGKALVDERFQFGALGVDEKEGHFNLGYWFPGSEVQVDYRSQATPKPVRARGRFHPNKDGFVQQYRVEFRFGRGESFPDFYRNAWRWAWTALNPAVNYCDIEAARRSLIDMLADRVETRDGRSGITNAVTAAASETPHPDRKAIMGFTGKNIESAVFLLEDADRDRSPRGQKHRELGLAIIDTFLRLKVSPPEGEGFNLDTGRTELALPRENRVYLRSFTDDMKMLLKAYRREKKQGRDHSEWLRWCQGFADWLLAQQSADGSFPRTWRPGAGDVVDAGPESSYNAVPMLVLLSPETGEKKYLAAANRAADFCWKIAWAKGRFVGGTIDNPNVVDKEAGTLSLEAYLTLYEATKAPQWLDRARVAADFSETWVYIWNVPMAEDEDNSALHWKRGVSTIGANTINSSDSAVDQYMAFDADEFAKLYTYTRDAHYLDVARILLHNTKNMLALPGRSFDLIGPGWQQEHWRMVLKRGYGYHRLWLPWVSTSHLNGIFGLEDFDPVLFKRLASKDGAE